MTIFLYDKTFEGLLTAVFDAYFRRTFPDRLLRAGEPVPLFTELTHTVYPDPAKADRVWKGLQSRLGREVCNMIMHGWLSDEPGADELIFRFVCKIFDSPKGAATNFADADILDLKNLGHKVSREGRFMVQFVRFQKAADGTFFAPVSPKYNALPLAINYFKGRFADQRWMIYDTKRNYGYYYDMKKVTEITLEQTDFMEGGRLDEKMMAMDEKQFQELWKGYYKSITIRERINLKLHRQHMPRRFWQYLTEKQ